MLKQPNHVIMWVRHSGDHTLSEFENKEQANGAIEKALELSPNPHFKEAIWFNYVERSSEIIDLKNSITPKLAMLHKRMFCKHDRANAHLKFYPIK